MDALAALNRQFALFDELHFESGAGGLIFARIANRHASAEIALQGAHVCRFQPAGNEDMLWLSPKAQFTAGKAIRGGIPVCWPWFGPHPEKQDWPAHGFARNTSWQVCETASLADGATGIVFALDADAMPGYWPHACRLEYRVTVGATLKLELTTLNTGSDILPITEALHAYFAVSEVGGIGIQGLEGCGYVDQANGGQLRSQDGVVTIRDETDRVYLDTESACLIEDPAARRSIRIAKTGSRSTIVWNPGPAKAQRLGDLGAGNERGMVCVESGNALGNVVNLEPGGCHTLAAEYSIEKLG